MSESLAARTSSGSIVFTLVHGTFANGTDWVNPEKSNLRPALEEALSDYHVQFDDGFSWGYDTWRYRDNFERTRDDGARRLENHLLQSPPASPVLGHFLLAHSHGGNVALSVFKNDAVRARVHGLICLATPFLFSRRRPLPRRFLAYSAVFVGVLISELTRGRLSLLYWWLLLVFVGVYGVLMLAALVDFVSRRRRRTGDKVVDRVVASGLVDDRVGLLTEMPRQFPLLIIRPSGDEASGLLRTSQFVTWLLGKLLGGLDSLLGILTSLVLLLGYGRQAATKIGQWLGGEDAVKAWLTRKAWMFNFDPLFATVLAVGCVIVVLIAAQQLSFRFDRLHQFASVEPMVEDAPPGIEARLLVLRPYRSQGLKLVHTQVYDKPETPRAIADWVRQTLGLAKSKGVPVQR